MGWRELTIPPRSGKSPSYEAVAGIFLHLLSLQTLGSALASADRSRLREGDPQPPVFSLLLSSPAAQ